MLAVLCSFFYSLDLLKVDVEGALERVLAGARQTLARARPLLAVESLGPRPPTEGVLGDLQYRCEEVIKAHRSRSPRVRHHTELGSPDAGAGTGPGGSGCEPCGAPAVLAEGPRGGLALPAGRA
ncbi:unnamed protein product [Prorocentrum cordatum]|uniref:Methyltransferase FkbM domain-containing protein n=1 Tax=Prorocentrum cordatum TaxID=2364126 RepID=A0ABN9VIR7_9DINO|nr:unnamed protein product [Polarella glacialis]